MTPLGWPLLALACSIGTIYKKLFRCFIVLNKILTTNEVFLKFGHQTSPVRLKNFKDLTFTSLPMKNEKYPKYNFFYENSLLLRTVRGAKISKQFLTQWNEKLTMKCLKGGEVGSWHPRKMLRLRKCGDPRLTRAREILWQTIKMKQCHLFSSFWWTIN